MATRDDRDGRGSAPSSSRSGDALPMRGWERRDQERAAAEARQKARGFVQMRGLEDRERGETVLRHLDGVHRSAFLRALAQVLWELETQEDRHRNMRQLEKDSTLE